MGKAHSTGGAVARYSFLLLFITLCFPSLAAAWEIAAVRDGTGAVAFCRAALRDNDSPLTLLIALSTANEVNIGIKVPDANFTKGEGYDVALAIDDKWSKKATAETALDDMLLVRLGKADDFLKALSKGSNVVLTGDADATTFPLNGSKDALATLQKCLKVAAEPAPKEASYQSSNDLTPEQMPEGLAALLIQAKIDAVPVPLPDTPGRMVDYAWVVQGAPAKVDGGFLETQVDKTATLEKLVDAQLERYAKQCRTKAAVKRDAPETYKTLALQTATMTCGNENGAFMFYKTDTNLFAVVIHRAADAKAATAAQGKVAGVIRRLAKAEGEKQ